MLKLASWSGRVLFGSVHLLLVSTTGSPGPSDSRSGLSYLSRVPCPGDSVMTAERVVFEGCFVLNLT